MIETSTSNDAINDATIKEIDKARMLKTLCYALRHKPWKFGIDLNEEGLACFATLVQSLCNRRKEYRETAPEILMQAIRELDSERFEVRDRMIRARYGHSFPVPALGEVAPPPEVLYHGTSLECVSSIKEDGLLSVDRYFLHLTSSREYAANVGTAKGEVCILRVRAMLAYEAGIVFRRATPHVWLTSLLPAKFLEASG